MTPQDRPISLKLKDYLIRKMSVKMMLDEKVISAVVDHQFKELNSQMEKVDSIEIVGFGRFNFNRKKAEKNLLLWESFVNKWETDLPEATGKKKENLELKIRATSEEIKKMKERLTWGN